MMYTKQDGPFLYDDTTGDIVGVKDPDGSEHLFNVTLSNQGGMAPGAHKNLVIQSINNDANISITANAICVADAASTFRVLTAMSLTLNGLVNGANGLDTGTLTAAKWYYIYVIYNASTSTKAALLSLDPVTPTLPSGYTLWARVGSVRTQAASAIFELFTQKGNAVTCRSNETSWKAVLSAGSATTWTAVDCSAYIPPTAVFGRFSGINSGVATSEVFLVAPRGVDWCEHTYATTSNGVTAIQWAIDIPLPIAQTIYYKRQSGASGSVKLVAYGYIESI